MRARISELAAKSFAHQPASQVCVLTSRWKFPFGDRCRLTWTWHRYTNVCTLACIYACVYVAAAHRRKQRALNCECVWVWVLWEHNWSNEPGAASSRLRGSFLARGSRWPGHFVDNLINSKEQKRWRHLFRCVNPPGARQAGRQAEVGEGRDTDWLEVDPHHRPVMDSVCQNICHLISKNQLIRWLTENDQLIGVILEGKHV